MVTNVTNFGAFVDIGVHQDGLVHISALTDRFIKDPRDVVKAGDIVKVKVLEVDKLVLFLLVLGFPLVLFFAWAYELTPEGLNVITSYSIHYTKLYEPASEGDSWNRSRHSKTARDWIQKTPWRNSGWAFS